MFICKFRLREVWFYFIWWDLRVRMWGFFWTWQKFWLDLVIFWWFRFWVFRVPFDRWSWHYRTIFCWDRLWRLQWVFRAFFIYLAFFVCTFGVSWWYWRFWECCCYHRCYPWFYDRDWWKRWIWTACWTCYEVTYCFLWGLFIFLTLGDFLSTINLLYLLM